MTQSNELLPCPFCGETTDNGFLAHKGSCYIMQKAVGANPETLKDAWNTRADLTPPQSPNRAVLDALDKWDNQGEINHEELCLFIECTREHLKRQKGR